MRAFIAVTEGRNFGSAGLPLVAQRAPPEPEVRHTIKCAHVRRFKHQQARRFNPPPAHHYP